MASEEAVEAAQLRGTKAAKVSPGTGSLGSVSSNVEKVTWTMNFL